MSWPTIAIVVAVSLASVLAIAMLVPLLKRLFAVLGSLADKWRPTPVGQARPGHERLGVGIVFVAAPFAVVLWYNLIPALAALAGGSLMRVDLQAMLALILILVCAPAAGIGALLSWKNVRLEFSGDEIRQTTMFGRQREWEKVTAASVYRHLRGPSAVYFDLRHGRFRTDTAWINIRDAYESLGRAGVPIEPWQEQVAR